MTREESAPSPSPEQLQQAYQLVACLRTEIAKVIIGQQEVIDQVLIGLFGAGHVLIEGVPGTGKTLLINAFSKISGVKTLIATIPDPDTVEDRVKADGMRKALAYMGLEAGTPITAVTVDKVFIGSCTNSRIEDLRAAAEILRGKKVAVKRAMVVPGSGLVRAQAEEEGLDKIFTNAGFEWREPGCSMCLAMNADRLEPGDTGSQIALGQVPARDPVGHRGRG